ncbi:hypothetical protein IM40_00490 [Candidatus Paracaedimonas acanthamoebae]|nr:hypothetical protein IM40_00490 [Candidatus Paracaedimonas acanthamoebae]
MNLIIRLLRVFLYSFFRTPLDFFEISIVSFRVVPTDLDLNLHMTNSRYLSVMDLGRLDLLLRSKGRTFLFKKKWQAVLGASHIRFRRSLQCFQKFELHSRIIGWDEKWFYIEQRIFSKGQLITIAILKALFISKKGSVPTQKVFSELKVALEKERLTPTIKHWLEMEESIRGGN